MKIFYGKEYHRKVRNPLDCGFQPNDRDRCVAAVNKFRDNPRLPGLNFEPLGPGRKHNHWSIRARKWHSPKMLLRWTTVGLLYAEKAFHQVCGYRDLTRLAKALQRNKESNLERLPDQSGRLPILN